MTVILEHRFFYLLVWFFGKYYKKEVYLMAAFEVEQEGLNKINTDISAGGINAHFQEL